MFLKGLTLLSGLTGTFFVGTYGYYNHYPYKVENIIKNQILNYNDRIRYTKTKYYDEKSNSWKYAITTLKLSNNCNSTETYILRDNNILSRHSYSTFLLTLPVISKIYSVNDKINNMKSDLHMFKCSSVKIIDNETLNNKPIASKITYSICNNETIKYEVEKEIKKDKYDYFYNTNGVVHYFRNKRDAKLCPIEYEYT